jgi:hypothetical protein
MPGPRQSLDDYVRDRIVQLGTIGGTVREAFAGVDDAAGEWATLHGWVTFGEFDAGVLGIFENLVLGDDGSPHRTKYGYECMYDDDHLFRYDFDPVQHPEMPYHKHVSKERPVKWDRVTLQEVLDEFWPLVVERDEALRTVGPC